MTNLDDSEQPLSQVEVQLATWTEEALRLRFESVSEIDYTVVGTDSIRRQLHLLRQAMDAVERLQGNCLRVRGRARRAAKHARSVADEGWDQAVVQQPRVEYQGPRERYAEASLRTFTEQRTAREGEQLVLAADTAYEVVRSAYQGLNSMRQDLRAMLHALQFESTLER
jgi:hypothetical protein